MLPIVVSMWLSTRSYFYFGSEELSCPLLDLARLRMGDWNAFKQSVSGRNGAHSAIHTPTSTLNAALPWTLLIISYVSWCCAVCKWSKVSSLHSSTAASLFSTRTATFDTGARARSAGIDGGSILYLTANTDCHESHKPKCVDSWDQNRIDHILLLSHSEC